MDTDFAVSCPLVRCWRLLSGFCPSTRTFAPCFLRTPPRGGSPCIITRPSPPSGWPEDFHLQAAEHVQHTTNPLARRTYIGGEGDGSVALALGLQKGGFCDPLRRTMLEELQRRNYASETIRSYILLVKQFAEYFGKSPPKMGAEEIRRFQLYLLREKNWTPARWRCACQPCAFSTRRF
jgi:hypothetical protein